MKTNKLSGLILFGLLQIMLTQPAAAVTAEKEDFYWKNSYTRGVGAIPKSHDCESGKDEDAGLCYTPCKAGYNGIGPVCWQQDASYGRGVGTIPSSNGCHDGKEKQSGLCYTPCKAGYNGKGPVCWRQGPDSYGRGVGKALSSICDSGMEADAGLCYTKCKNDFNGIGPVCWGSTPTGYVDCAAGFAKDKKTCAEITGLQVAAVAIFIGTTVVPEARAALKGARAAEEGEKAKSVFDALKPFKTKLEDAFSKLKKGLPGDGTLIADIKKFWKEIPEADKVKLKLAVKLASTSKSIANGQVNEIDLLRDAANIASVLDPSGLLAVAAAYTYPVYGVDY